MSPRATKKSCHITYDHNTPIKVEIKTFYDGSPESSRIYERTNNIYSEKIIDSLGPEKSTIPFSALPDEIQLVFRSKKKEVEALEKKGTLDSLCKIYKLY